jgi:hypothetical protein
MSSWRVRTAWSTSSSASAPSNAGATFRARAAGGRRRRRSVFSVGAVAGATAGTKGERRTCASCWSKTTR